MHAFIKSKVKTIALIAAAHSIVWWGALYGLRVSGFSLFKLESLFGFAPPPRHSVVQTVLFQSTCVLTYPLAWVPGLETGTWFTTLLLVAANGIIWGTCISLFIYTVKQKDLQGNVS